MTQETIGQKIEEIKERVEQIQRRHERRMQTGVLITFIMCLVVLGYTFGRYIV